MVLEAGTLTYWFFRIFPYEVATTLRQPLKIAMPTSITKWSEIVRIQLTLHPLLFPLPHNIMQFFNRHGGHILAA